MSEPDHRTFFTTPRSSDVENQVIPMRNGVGSQKYKPVDYKHLYELAAVEKMASAKIKLKENIYQAARNADSKKDPRSLRPLWSPSVYFSVVWK